MFQQGLFGEVIEELRPPAKPAPMTLDFETHAVRMIMIKNQPWWVAADVCRAMTIANHKDAVSRLDNDEKSVVGISDPHGREQMTTVINEAGLWSLVLSSTKAEAKRFKRWLTHEVLPSIRKTGSYTLPQQTRVAKVQKKLKSDLATAERRVEVIDRNKQSSARLSEVGQGRPGFIAWFDGLNKAQFNGKTSADLKQLLDLKYWETPLDHMGEIPLSQRSHAICLAERKIQDRERAEGKPLSMDEQLEIIYETVRYVVDSSFTCLGDVHGFGVRPDPRRGPVLDVVLRLPAA